jgi:hypothetical protein
MKWLATASRSLLSAVTHHTPTAFQAGSLGFVALAAYDVARPLGHLAVALGLGLIGYAADGGKR